MNSSAVRRLANNRSESARNISAQNKNAQNRVNVTNAKTKSALARFSDVDSAVKTLRPTEPLLCMHPDAIAQSAAQFLQNFPGHSLYAVKSNPDQYVLNHLFMAGIRHFDVASLGEIKLIRGLFGADAQLAFMHPVKSRESIRKAYFEHNVRAFVLDSMPELRKIREETGHASDLTLVVRLAMPKGSAACALAGKFGAMPDDGVALLQEAAKTALRVGVSFHVGSQTLDPQSYADAIRKAGDIVKRSGVLLEVMDVGGGFPIAGLGMEIPPLSAFFDVIKTELAALSLPATCEVWCEPGRALSGNSATLVARVELRKGDVLYLNDGSYGNMFEVCAMKWRNDARVIRADGNATQAAKPFSFFGPTCDSVDYMAGPFALPDDVTEGDWIALSGMGAYGSASQSGFNGFFSDLKVEIRNQDSARLVRLRPRRKE